MTTTAETPTLSQLLPFWVNGTLDADEARAVGEALSRDPGLKAEAEALTNLRASMLALPQDRSPGEFGLARLERAIAAEQMATRPARRLWQPLAAAAIAASIAVLGTWLVTGPAGTGADGFVQASGQAPVALTVAFRAEASQGDIAALLTDSNLTIIDGPSAAGLYRLAVLEGGDIALAAQSLSAHPDLIESVELPQ